MRIRTIKPDFWTSTDIAGLSEAEALLFVGLWNYAQDNGVGRDDPRLLKAALYPLRDDVGPGEVERRMMRLAAAGLIERYRDTHGMALFYIPKWDSHQVINRPSRTQFTRPTRNTQRVLPEPSVSPLADAGGEVEVEGEGEVESGRGKLLEQATPTTDTITTPEATPTDSIGQVMGAVRKYLYVPDGKAPSGWDDGRDVRIAKMMLLKGTSLRDLLDAIEGVALVRERGEVEWLKPGQKTTLRVLYHTRNGVLPMMTLALNALYASPARNRSSSPRKQGGVEKIGNLLTGGGR